MEDNGQKKTSRLVGILFLIQMITASVSHSAILVPILHSSNFPANVSAHATEVTIAMLLDLITGLSVFGISVLLFPFLKKFNEIIALWYVGLRLYEFVCAVISGIFLMTILSLSKDYIHSNNTNSTYLQLIASYFLQARGMTKTLMLLGFCFSASLFYYLLYKTKLLPRFISVWGFLGVVLLFAEIMANIFDGSLGGIMIMLPLGLNEIFLGLWLIVSGFKVNPIENKS